MGIETNFDIPFVAALALREKQIQQNYRPYIAVHKWFARRPGTLFRSLILSEYSTKPLREAFYQGNNLAGLEIADPFMGGGTPLLEANRLGCNVLGFDINPMAYWIVKQEIEHLNLDEYAKTAKAFISKLTKTIGDSYTTTCLLCGDTVPAKYYLWVKQVDCDKCGKPVDLFPGYILAEAVRHPKNVIICPKCGVLNERGDLDALGGCDTCGTPLVISPVVKRSHRTCTACGHSNKFPKPETGSPKHRLFAIEYHCQRCKPGHAGRFFKSPDKADMAKVEIAEKTLSRSRLRFVPTDEIPKGDETDRLHRWGYRRYREMFNARQLIGLEASCREIAKIKSERVRNALATNLSDLLRYQNMLCRYDTMALKSLDIFSVHGFPVGLVQCESNLLGIGKVDETAVGSGGWKNIIAKFTKAKSYCDNPFEIRMENKRKVVIPIEGEWIGDRLNGVGKSRKVSIRCGDSAAANIAPASLDGVFTDPPYFGNVQYAELMDFCYVWLRTLIDGADAAFAKRSTRDEKELTGNATLERGLDNFAGGLSSVFSKMAVALKPGSPLVFTYHHNDIEAYAPLAVAILDAGLVCTATLPCPAEMSASIHISGTKSSIVDTVLVCRSTGTLDADWLQKTPSKIAGLVGMDLAGLAAGGREPTTGDTLCIINGHLVRLTIWKLRQGWDKSIDIAERLTNVLDCFKSLPSPSTILPLVEKKSTRRKETAASGGPLFPEPIKCNGATNAISF